MAYGSAALLLQLIGSAIVLDSDSVCAERDGEEE
jgi:hypothetical protein